MAKRIRKRDLIIEFLQLITGIGVKKGKKAAPRFELGIKDLQSSALPLGHAAENEISISTSNRISQSEQNVLFLSNGHGEDTIACKVMEALHGINSDISQGPSTVELIGHLILGKYLLPFELISVLLLAALAGSAMLARKKLDDTPPAINNSEKENEENECQVHCSSRQLRTTARPVRRSSRTC